MIASILKVSINIYTGLFPFLGQHRYVWGLLCLASACVLSSVWCLVGVSVNKPTNSRQTRGGAGERRRGHNKCSAECRQDWEQVAKFGEVYEASGASEASGGAVVGPVDPGACLWSEDGAPFKVFF